MKRTPLLFNRSKTEKQLLAVFIRAYYSPLITQNDVIFSDENKGHRCESQTEKKNVGKEEKEEGPRTQEEKMQKWARD